MPRPINAPAVTRRTFLAGSLPLAAGLAVPSLLAAPARSAWAAEQPLDLLIAGGMVIDGTGAKRRRADVGIRDGRIVAVGPLANTAAAQGAGRTIDAGGCVVSPGFIDMHSHSDRTLLVDGDAHSAVRQGATTHVVGNCGSSPAPVIDAGNSSREFRNFADFIAALRKQGTSVNVAPLVGHNTVRVAVMGYERRAPTAAELGRMKEWIAEAMKAGAIGMSTGLVSPPGTYSQTEEIIELARVVAAHNGIYASHIRGEASTLIDAVTEAIRIGREAELPVEISHHKAAGKENWGKTRVTLKLIEQAVADGQQLRMDVYPYRAGSAGLSQLVPPWAHEGGDKAMLARLRDPATRKQVVHDMNQGAEGWANFFQVDWDDIQITRVRHEANRQWVGKKVGDIARARGCTGVDACIDLLIEEELGVGMINFVIDEQEMRGVLRHPLSLIGSDGMAVSPESYAGQPHPRFYGCFPRVLGRYCREERLFDLETAVRKMTGAPAEHLGLTDRGVVRPGAWADLVLFSPDEIIDQATFDAPHQYPSGIRQVLVNGQVVIDQKEGSPHHTHARPGVIASRPK